MKLLLHACCGPCSLEPVRLLQAAGHTLSLAYMNANIHPPSEYARRLTTLATWAANEHLTVIEGAYDKDAWEQQVGCFGIAAETREDRCRACYRLRLEEAAHYAASHGFEGIATTLSVSPYQYTALIEEELKRAAAAEKIAAVFEDFRPFYPQATQASKALGMYRQNYCGCRYSAIEAACEREQRADERRARKQAERSAHAAQREEAETQRLAKKRARQEYAAKQTAKRIAKDRLRNQKHTEDPSENTTPNTKETLHENQ
ncbi:MAG: epoxyqueuosine reductase QueH [Raoultibacter sp.]